MIGIDKLRVGDGPMVGIPYGVRNFLLRFDRGYSVKPFTFELVEY